MHTPYTTQPSEALVVAQTSAALVLTAITWSRPSRPPPGSFALIAAAWWAALLPIEPELLLSFGVHIASDHMHWAMRGVEFLTTAGAVLTGRPLVALLAVAAQFGFWRLDDYVVNSEWELAALHLVLLGLLVGLQARHRDEDIAAVERPPERSFLAHDARLFALATLLAIAVCMFVLEQSIDSSDEWAYTFQAAVFAKGRAFAPAPPCADAYQNFWVFEWMGRLFAQYTPGWPLFMAPFALIGVPQFAASFSLGLFVVGVARLARRASRDSGHAAPVVAAAGTFAGLCATFSSTMLVNGGSRFGHVFAAALLAWAIEATCATEEACERGKRGAQWGWSILLGACIALIPSTRPGDGTVSAVGLGLYGLYALARRRYTLRAAAGFGASCALLGGLTLVILRLQLGTWFTTGYSLTPVFHSWGTLKMSWPDPPDWRWGVPIATGSYCWWPLSLAVGVAGLAMLRKRAGRIAFMLGLGTLALFVFCCRVELGRGYDWGYGPRYVLTATVLMAVGTGVALGPLWARARASYAPREPLAGGPVTMAVLALALGVVRLFPLVYPLNTASVRSLNALNAEIRREQIHHAVVLLPTGSGWPNEGLDLTMNLPVSLFPKQDVIIAMDRSPALTQCVRDRYPDRTFYSAVPGPTIHPAPSGSAARPR